MKSLEIEKGEFINLDNVNVIDFKYDNTHREYKSEYELCGGKYYIIDVTFTNKTNMKWRVEEDVGRKLEQIVQASSLL